MSLRGVHVIDSLALGGTETQCVALVDGLAVLGVTSHVVYFQPGPLLARLDGPRVTTGRMDAGGGFARPGFARLVLRLAGVMRAERADVVQSYGFYSNLPAVLAGRLAGVRVLVASQRGFATGLRASQRRVDRLARRLAHRTVVNAEAIRTRLVVDERADANALVVIPNSVIARGPVVAAVDPIVGMVANFRHPKDHATLLRALVRVIEAVPNVETHLVGSGPEERATRRLAAELGIAPRVHFVGALAPDAVRDAIDRFAVAVLSSLSEGMPNAVLEAMVASRPVVATAVGGVPEVVADGVTGYLVPPGNDAAMAAAIARLLKEPSLAAAMGAAGRRHAVTAHGPTRMARAFLDLYRSLGASS